MGGACWPAAPAPSAASGAVPLVTSAPGPAVPLLQLRQGRIGARLPACPPARCTLLLGPARARAAPRRGQVHGGGGHQAGNGAAAAGLHGLVQGGARIAGLLPAVTGWGGWGAGWAAGVPGGWGLALGIIMCHAYLLCGYLLASRRHPATLCCWPSHAGACPVLPPEPSPPTRRKRRSPPDTHPPSGRAHRRSRPAPKERSRHSVGTLAPRRVSTPARDPGHRGVTFVPWASPIAPRGQWLRHTPT